MLACLLTACAALVAVNCWPNETNSGCDVNIEYELEQDNMELNDVSICIPLPSVSVFFLLVSLGPGVITSTFCFVA